MLGFIPSCGFTLTNDYGSLAEWKALGSKLNSISLEVQVSSLSDPRLTSSLGYQFAALAPAGFPTPQCLIA